VEPIPARTARAEALVTVITTSEVPAAYSIGRARASTRAGTTRNPPPTPRNPVSRPTVVAVTSTFSALGHWQAKAGLNVMIGSSSCGRPVRADEDPGVVVVDGDLVPPDAPRGWLATVVASSTRS